jgi:uncharacterized membrane protein YgcG
MGLFGKKQATHALGGSAMSSSVTPLEQVAQVGNVAAMPGHNSLHMGGGGFDVSFLKNQLVLAQSRAEIQKNKAINKRDTTRREVIRELEANRNPTATIAVEKLLRETAVASAFDSVIMYCELLADRCSNLAQNSNFASLESDVREAIASLGYASTRMTNKELTAAISIMRTHFGSSVLDPLLRCEGPHRSDVSKHLALKLDGSKPDDYIIQDSLIRIAREENIHSWTAPPEPEDLRHESYNGGGGSGYSGSGYGGGGGGGSNGGGGGSCHTTNMFAAANVPGASAPPIQQHDQSNQQTMMQQMEQQHRVQYPPAMAEPQYQAPPPDAAWQPEEFAMPDDGIDARLQKLQGYPAMPPPDIGGDAAPR